MSTATATLVRRHLRELRRLKGRVDRAAGVIYGVKVVGLSSPNTHGVRGAEGTTYTSEALSRALPLYEGIKVNVDHPPRGKPGMERSARDRFAWLEDAHLAEGGIFADLHFLDPTDPLAVKMMNAAEENPSCYALSHNAVGRGEVRGGRYVVVEIPEVHSVDIVADGGTNRSLFESKDASGHEHDEAGKFTGKPVEGEHKGMLQAGTEVGFNSGEHKGKRGQILGVIQKRYNKEDTTYRVHFPGEHRPATRANNWTAQSTPITHAHLMTHAVRPSVSESREYRSDKAMLTSVREVLKVKVLPALQAGRKRFLARLCESMPDTLLMEDDEGKDHLDHLYSAMRSAKDGGHDEIARGVHKLMHPDKHDLEEEEGEGEKEKEEEEEDGEGRERSEMEGMGEEGPGEGGEHNQGPDGKGGPATAWEGRRVKKVKAGQVRLTEAQALSMCRTAGVEATADLVTSLREARSFDGQMAAINLAKRAQQPARGTSAPRSAARVGLRESVAPAGDDVKGWLARLRG